MTRSQWIELGGAALVALAVLSPSGAFAAETKTATTAVEKVKTATTAAVVKEQPKPAAAPYTLPFQLRGVTPGRVFRIDTQVAAFDSKLNLDPAVVSFFTLGYAFTPEIGLAARIAYVNASTVNDDRRGSIFSNPALIATWAPKIHPDLRFSGVLGVALPFGGGGGDNPNPYSKNARTAAALAAAAMHNAMFAPNDLCLAPGVDIAYVKHGVTLQAEATAIFAFRMRGEQDQPDERKVNFTTGLHFGYFIAPWVSFGTELRYQRWISPPKAVDKASNRDALMDTVSIALGPRLHFKLSDSSWLRPAITYSRGLDDPMSASNYQIVQIDLPFSY